VATPTLVKSARSTRSTIALKMLMAGSGLIFIGFLLLHMYGNLKVFAGEEAFNAYAHHLRTFGEPMLPYEGLLWVIRAVLLVSLIVHVTCAIILTGRAHKARTTKYVMKKNKGSSIASRTMRWGGLALFLFIVWHLFNFTIGKYNPQGHGTDNPFQLYVDNFETPWITAIYLAAMAALAMHLLHGVWSACQTLGLTNSARSRARAKDFGVLVAVLIAGGFSLGPIAVVFGLI